jgi:hypothetical protein
LTPQRRERKLSNKILELTTLHGAQPQKLLRNMASEQKRESISSNEILPFYLGLVII